MTQAARVSSSSSREITIDSQPKSFPDVETGRGSKHALGGPRLFSPRNPPRHLVIHRIRPDRFLLSEGDEIRRLSLLLRHAIPHVHLLLIALT